MLSFTYFCCGRPNFKGFYQLPKRQLEAFCPKDRDRVIAKAHQDVENVYLSYDGYCALEADRYARGHKKPEVVVVLNHDVVELIHELPYVNFYEAFAEIPA